MAEAPKATKAFDVNGLQDQLALARTVGIVDEDLEHEVQTDKTSVKLVPCRECRRALVVTTFFAPAKAICRSCKGETAGEGRQATVGQPVAGQTDPAKAVNLADCLVNKHFAHATCPVRPDEHEMELKSVNHSPQYGPGYFVGKMWRQTDVGETVIHQCKDCLAVVTYSTTFRTKMRRQNEVKIKPDTGPREASYLHGVEGPIPPAAVEAKAA